MPREERKRKRKETDESSDEERAKRRPSKSISPSPSKEKRNRSKSRSMSPTERGGGGGGGDFSLSIEETNKLRAQLGLAPLEVDDKPKVRDAEDGITTDKIINEEGFEFRHRKADNWGDKKKDESIREKIEVAKKKREIYDKVLKSKGLAEDSSDDEASDWVSKQRNLEEERKKAEERAKLLDQMDEEFDVSSIIEEKKKTVKRDAKRAKQKAQTAGLLVGHSKLEFLSGQDQILVLEDKGVLDDGDEVLVNPNIVDKERTTRNVELKKKKGRDPEDQFDEFGNPIDRGMLAKYDEELEGAPRSKFRLDESGEVDVEREREEEEMRKRLMLAGKTLFDLDTSNKYTKASEYYTQEEMISFRKVKKEKKDKKTRKRGKEKVLKADDLEPIEQAGNNDLGSRGARRKHHEEEDEGKETGDRPAKKEQSAEDGEIEDEMPEIQGGKWRRTQQQAVDLDALKRVVEREMEEEDSDDDLVSGVDLSDVVLDYDAENELQSLLEKARRLKQQPSKKDNIKLEIKHEAIEEADEQQASLDDGVVMIDSTMEYCRNIGEIRTHGIAGNRDDAIDYEAEEDIKPAKIEDEEKTRERIKRYKEEKRRRQQAEKEMKGGWTETLLNPEEPAELINEEDEEILREMKNFKGSDSDSDEDDEENGEDDVLGGEIDATKGIGAMLKLAAKKGYLEDVDRKKVSGENLDHLKSKNFSKVETAKYDIEEKYTKKLEKMGTTGRGPTQEFCEKKNYKPDVDLNYVDTRGRELDPKDAFRIMSWKFHGKMPGKRQQEKRARQIDQKELLKTYVSSSDTPLGTLSRQRKKQEQLQTPYLVLSGNSSHQNFKKD